MLLIATVYEEGLIVPIQSTMDIVAEGISGFEIQQLESTEISLQVSSVGEAIIPFTNILGPNFPNPFNPQTTIAFELPKRMVVNLRVFDLSGRLVKVLLDGETMASGHNEATWDGRNSDGRPSAAGVYLYRLDSGEFSETKRMALVK